MRFIMDLEHLCKDYDHNDKISFSIIRENYLTNKIDEIIKGREIYNIDHPLFGYNPFFGKLIEAYAHNENYEKCIELREYYSLNKKQNEAI